MYNPYNQYNMYNPYNQYNLYNTYNQYNMYNPYNHEDFMSVKKFNVFNTNNLWISMAGIQRVIKHNLLDMEIIVNPLPMEHGKNMYQLVTAIGAAMKCFDNAVGLRV